MNTNNLVTGSLGKYWWMVLLYGIVAVLCGLYAIAAPIGAAIVFTWIIGAMSLADGVVSLFGIARKERVQSKGWLVFYALTSVLFGLVAIVFPIVTASVLMIFLGAWLIIAGVFRIILAIEIRKQINNEWLMIASGVLSILLGGLFLLSPLAGIVTMSIWIGAAIILLGIFQIMTSLRLKKLQD